MLKSMVTALLLACLMCAAAIAQSDTGVASPDEPRVSVQGYQFSGNSVIDSETLSGIVAPSQGKDLSLAELRAVADSITAFYHRQGYFLAMTVLPEQEIVNGIVHLQIFEGRIGKAVITGNVNYSTNYLMSYLNRMQKEGVFRRKTMDRALLLMNSLPGIKVTSVLQAGETQGTTDIVVTIKEGKQTRTNFSVDNFGSQYARVRARTGVDFINRLGRGDTISLNGVTGINSDKLYYFNGSFLIPLDTNGTTLGMYGLSGDFGIGKEFAVLDIQGRANAMGITISRTLHIDSQKSRFLEYGLDARNSKQNILGMVSSDDRIRSLRVSMKWTSENATGRSFASVTAQQGLGETLGGMPNASPMSSRSAAGADNNFTKFNIEYGRAQRLGPKSSLISRLAGQLSLSDLVVGEQMAIGGADSVRGYPQAEYLGDSGIRASIEARFASSEEQMEKFQLATFVDFGYITVKVPVLGQRKTSSLTGAGVGFRYNPGNGLFMSADVGFPLGEKPSSGKSATYYLHLTKYSE